VLFSVVIPLYNKAQYVETAVRSVLDQRHKDVETIVVDDGSTDDGPQRVLPINNLRLRLVRQSNRGAAAARNRGIREARGQYIAFLDADDYWEPGFLSAIANTIREFPGCGMYATHFYWFHENGFRRVDDLWGISGAQPRLIDRFFEFWGHSKLFCTCSVVIPAHILHDSAIAFPEGEQLGEDQDVWFRIAERWSVGYFPQPLVGYRVGVPGSTTVSYPGEILPYIKRLRARYVECAIPPMHRRGVRRILALHLLNIARFLLLRGERRRAVKLLGDPLCLLAPRYLLRVLMAACIPIRFGRRLIQFSKEKYQSAL